VAAELTNKIETSVKMEPGTERRCRGHEWQGIGKKLEVADVLGSKSSTLGGKIQKGTMICERSSAYKLYVIIMYLLFVV
jgi:hypothetical protein